ncbi:MAG: hypothetical protein V4649_13385 [Bacteroidota bacterium]
MSIQEYQNPNDRKTVMTTLTDCLEFARENGYTLDFTVNQDTLYCAGNERRYTPSQVKVADFYRFEGDSDPGDACILYLLETNDNLKGTILDAYGTYSDRKIEKFMANIDDLTKKNAQGEA